MKKTNKILTYLAATLAIFSVTNYVGAINNEIELPKIADNVVIEKVKKTEEKSLVSQASEKDVIIKNNEEERKEAQDKYKEQVEQERKERERKSAEERKEKERKAAEERKTKEETARKTQSGSSSMVYTIDQFEFMGRISWGGKVFTYYSERVLPGGGLRIPGRHTSGGYVRDGDGYIVLASDYYAKGTVISTPFGSPGKVYDAFGTGEPSYRFDVYTR